MIVLAFLKDKTLVEAMEEVLTLLQCIGFALCIIMVEPLFLWYFVVRCILLVEPHSQNLFEVLGFTFSITLCIVLVCITLLAEPHTASVHSIVPSKHKHFLLSH